MRDLIFKNLTSIDKKRRILSSSETMDSEGVRSIIRRHFIYIVKEIKNNQVDKPLPCLYVLREHNNKERKKKFLCRMKGSLFAIIDGKLFLILFMHSLKINMTLIP